jgi:hypothetical protein
VEVYERAGADSAGKPDFVMCACKIKSWICRRLFFEFGILSLNFALYILAKFTSEFLYGLKMRAAEHGLAYLKSDPA